MCGLLECIYGPPKYNINILTLPPYITGASETRMKGGFNEKCVRNIVGNFSPHFTQHLINELEKHKKLT